MLQTRHRLRHKKHSDCLGWKKKLKKFKLLKFPLNKFPSLLSFSFQRNIQSHNLHNTANVMQRLWRESFTLFVSECQTSDKRCAAPPAPTYGGTLDCMYSLQAMATFHSSVRNGGSYTSEVANHYLQTKGNKLVNTMCSNDFPFRFLFTSSKLCNVPSTVIAKTLQNSSGRSQRTVIKPLISSFGNIPFIGSAVRVKFSHYLALAHSALTSFSLMSSQRLSCSICRSRSLMSPIVTHIGRNCSHTGRTDTHTLLSPVLGRWGGCRRWHSCLQTDALPSDKDRGSLARLGTGNVAGWGAVRIGKTAILHK